MKHRNSVYSDKFLIIFYTVYRPIKMLAIAPTHPTSEVIFVEEKKKCEKSQKHKKYGESPTQTNNREDVLS